MPPKDRPDITMRSGSTSGRRLSQASAASTSREASSCRATNRFPPSAVLVTSPRIALTRSMMYGPGERP
jgi:hypothetical protein